MTMSTAAEVGMSAGNSSALEIENLTKRFGDRTAVDGLSLSVAKGEVFGFLGPNGAGKTTTVRMLGTLIAPSSGSAIVAGLALGPAERGRDPPAHLGHARVARALPPPERGREPRVLRRPLWPGRPELREYNALWRRSTWPAGPRTPCGTLSKGLRQRVGLARALLNDPEVVFLDEPTSGLDPVATHEVHELIDGLRKRGVTIFLTTHRLEEAERLCDRVAIFSTTLRSVGRPDELRDRLFKKQLLVETVAPSGCARGRLRLGRVGRELERRGQFQLPPVGDRHQERPPRRWLAPW